MPKLNLTKVGGTITFDQDDWLAELATNSAPAEHTKIGGAAAIQGINALREYGYLMPGANPTDVTNVSSITAYLRNAVVVNDNAYLIASDSLVHKLGTLTAGSISTTAPFPHTIDHGHASEAGQDIVVYYTGTTQRAFFSFNDATDWDVGIYNVVADTFDDDFMSTVPATPLAAPYLTGGQGKPHPIIVGDDDVLYIGDRNFIHAYDGQVGANGTFYPAVLTLPQGWIVTCFSLTQDINLAIGAYLTTSTATDNTFNRGSAKVWFWNYLDQDPDFSRDLRDNYISELIQWGGTIAAFTSGRNTLSSRGVNKLQALIGNQFQVIKTWNTNGLPIRGGVDNVENDLYWNSQSYVYAYIKRPDTGEYILTAVSNPQSGTSGLLKFLTQSSRIHYSWGAGANNGGLQYLSENYNTAIYQSPVVAPPFAVRQKGRLKSLTIAFADSFVTGGRELELVSIMDRASITTTGSITVSTDQRFSQFTHNADGTPLGDFNTLQLQLGWTGGNATTVPPIVEWVQYEFEFVNI